MDMILKCVYLLMYLFPPVKGKSPKKEQSVSGNTAHGCAV